MHLPTGSLKISFKYIAINTLRKKCAYSELFWSAFSRIRTKYGQILRISPFSVLMRENTERNNSEYGHVLRSDTYGLTCPFVYRKDWNQHVLSQTRRIYQLTPHKCLRWSLRRIYCLHEI